MTAAAFAFLSYLSTMITGNPHPEHHHDLGQAFWEEKWQTHATGWDIGYASPPIVQYFGQYPDKDAAILIPGCGNAYEAEFLVEQEFTDITLIDIAPEATARLREKFANHDHINILCKDFFQHQGQYDLIIEQTFFCALPPQKRPDYVRQCHSLLRPEGKITGLLFNRTFDRKGPPFGGSAAEYRALFQPAFDIRTMEVCTNSIPPRAGSELFINFVKRED